MTILIFTKTTGYRHESIPHAAATLIEIARELGMGAETSDDARCFAPGSLARFRAVIWLSTSGDVLSPGERAAFEAYMREGGAYVGIHGASATETDWPWYRELVGARFTRHPALQPARLIVEDREHPATRHLGPHWLRSDEWYEFDENPRGRVRVLISVDESTYEGGTMGDHPLVWCQELGPGRSFYTALGHEPEHFDEPEFRKHLSGGIRWTLGMER